MCTAISQRGSCRCATYVVLPYIRAGDISGNAYHAWQRVLARKENLK